LGDFSNHFDDTGERDANGDLKTSLRKTKEYLEYLKKHHEDVPIWKLDLPTIDKMAAYWKNRPKTKKAERCSWDHAHGMTKVLFRFLAWLDSSPAYKWESPKGIDKISRTPVRFPEEGKNGGAFQTTHKRTYTPEQLATLCQFTEDFGRVLIGVCVNCAFGAAEVGQWTTDRFILQKAHPHADKLGIESTDEDSWIVGPRPKTGIYGEHLLWREVATAATPFLDGRPVLPMTKNGKPWYRTHAKNPQSTFGNWWSGLLNRVQKSHKEFPRLPFGTLRDVLPDILRRDYTDEIASISLQHGKLGEDELLKCYANMPFGKLFEATRQLEPLFHPLLDAIAGGNRNRC